MADDDFSTGATLELEVSQRSLSAARDTIESELGDLEVDVNAVVSGNRSSMQPRDPGSGQFMAIEGVEQRVVNTNDTLDSVVQIETERWELDKIRNDYLEQLVESSGGGGSDIFKPRSGGGGGLGGFLGGAMGTIIGIGAIKAMSSLSNSMDNFDIPEIPPLKVPDIPGVPYLGPDPVPVEEPSPLPTPEPDWLPINIPEPSWLPIENPTGDGTDGPSGTGTPTPVVDPNHLPRGTGLTPGRGTGQPTPTPGPGSDSLIPTPEEIGSVLLGGSTIGSIIAGGMGNGPLYKGPDPLNAREHPGRAAVAGGTIAAGAAATQLDSPLPGPADVLGAGIIAAGLSLAGAGSQTAAADSGDGDTTVQVDNSTDVKVEQRRDDQQIIDDVMSEVDKEIQQLRRELERSLGT